MKARVNAEILKILCKNNFGRESGLKIKYTLSFGLRPRIACTAMCTSIKTTNKTGKYLK